MTIKRTSITFLFCLSAISLLAGCPELSNNETEENNTNNNKNNQSNPNGWVKAGLPCYSGVSYVALHFDGQVGYGGCGDSSNGAGLFVSKDGGMTWSGSARKFSSVRVVDIRRAPDGKLYGAGKDQLDGNRVFIIDDADVDSLKLESVFVPMTTSAFKKVERAQNIAVTADGQMFADSVTGTQAAYKPADSTEWEELESIGEESLTGEGSGTYQITKVRAFENKFYAIGSLIGDPASIRLPSKNADATYHFQTIRPKPNRAAELKDFHIWDANNILAVGHDQSERYPLIFLAEGDPYEVGNWTQIDVFDSGIEYQGGINRIAVKGDRVVAVGEKFPTSQGGFVLMSEDRGKTWTDITPQPTDGKKPKRFWNVWMWDNGSIYAFGEGEAWLLKK